MHNRFSFTLGVVGMDSRIYVLCWREACAGRKSVRANSNYSLTPLELASLTASRRRSCTGWVSKFSTKTIGSAAVLNLNCGVHFWSHCSTTRWHDVIK